MSIEMSQGQNEFSDEGKRDDFTTFRVNQELYTNFTDPRAFLVGNREEAVKHKYIKDYGREIDLNYNSLFTLQANKILGIEPPSQLQDELMKGLDLHRYLFNPKWIEDDEMKKQAAVVRALSHSSSAKILGVPFQLSDDEWRQMEEYVDRQIPHELKEFSPWSGHFSELKHTLIAEANVLGIPIEITDEKRESLSRSWDAAQRLLIKGREDYMNDIPTDAYKNYSEEEQEEDRKNFPFEHIWQSYILAYMNKLSETRLAGIEIPIYQHTIDTMRELLTSKKTKKDIYSFDFFASNFAIVAAKEVRIDDKNGIELIY